MVALERLLAVLAAMFFAIAAGHEVGYESGLEATDWIADPAYWWQTPDQAGAARYAEGDYRGASREFGQAAWRGTACFRATDYACAESAFADADMDAASRHFNLGNVAAHAGSFDKALTEYDAALAARPDWASAAHNRRIVLALIVERSRRPMPKQSDEEGDPRLDPEQAANERRALRRKAGRLEIEGIDPNSLAQIWLRQIRSDAGDFLRLRFADEAARRGTATQGGKQ